MPAFKIDAKPLTVQGGEQIAVILVDPGWEDAGRDRQARLVRGGLSEPQFVGF